MDLAPLISELVTKERLEGGVVSYFLLNHQLRTDDSKIPAFMQYKITLPTWEKANWIIDSETNALNLGGKIFLLGNI